MSEPTAGALRAADQLIGGEPGPCREVDVHRLALHIDRETKLPDLLRALEKANARVERLEKALTAITVDEIGQRYSQIIARGALAKGTR